MLDIKCTNKRAILEVSLSMSKFQVDPKEKWTSDLDSALKVMPKYKISCE